MSDDDNKDKKMPANPKGENDKQEKKKQELDKQGNTPEGGEEKTNSELGWSNKKPSGKKWFWLCLATTGCPQKQNALVY